MNRLARFSLTIGAVLAAISVAGGAFGAHGLKSLLDASGQAATWETAARYCMYHALALIMTGLLACSPARVNGLAAASACFVSGTLVFSGCLAILAVTGLKVLGAVVPIGGVLLIAGWVILAVAVARPRS